MKFIVPDGYIPVNDDVCEGSICVCEKGTFIVIKENGKKYMKPLKEGFSSYDWRSQGISIQKNNRGLKNNNTLLLKDSWVINLRDEEEEK